MEHRSTYGALERQVPAEQGIDRASSRRHVRDDPAAGRPDAGRRTTSESWARDRLTVSAGTSSWRVGGADVELPPGAVVFIRRGVVHGFDNRSGAPARCLDVSLTPGVLGPGYFREIAGLVAAGAPDPLG